MRPIRYSSALPARLWRCVAIVAAGLVLLLATSSVSPELHAWLHDAEKQDAGHVCPHHGGHAAAEHPAHTPDSNDGERHECAVTLFSHGVLHHAAALLTQPCEGILRAVNHRAFERLALAQPRYLHLPPQAPPAV